jgi:hypothetical protein
MVGDNDWVKEAIEDGLCIAVTDRLYIKQVHAPMHLSWSV